MKNLTGIEALHHIAKGEEVYCKDTDVYFKMDVGKAKIMRSENSRKSWLVDNTSPLAWEGCTFSFEIYKEFAVEPWEAIEYLRQGKTLKSDAGTIYKRDAQKVVIRYQYKGQLHYTGIQLNDFLSLKFKVIND